MKFQTEKSRVLIDAEKRTAGNVVAFLLNDIIIPLAETTVYGLSTLYRKITRRGKRHE